MVKWYIKVEEDFYFDTRTDYTYQPNPTENPTFHSTILTRKRFIAFPEIVISLFMSILQEWSTLKMFETMNSPF